MNTFGPSCACKRIIEATVTCCQHCRQIKTTGHAALTTSSLCYRVADSPAVWLYLAFYLTCSFTTSISRIKMNPSKRRRETDPMTSPGRIQSHVQDTTDTYEAQPTESSDLLGTIDQIKRHLYWLRVAQRFVQDWIVPPHVNLESNLLQLLEAIKHIKTESSCRIPLVGLTGAGNSSLST